LHISIFHLFNSKLTLSVFIGNKQVSQRNNILIKQVISIAAKLQTVTVHSYLTKTPHPYKVEFAMVIKSSLPFHINQAYAGHIQLGNYPIKIPFHQEKY